MSNSLKRQHFSHEKSVKQVRTAFTMTQVRQCFVWHSSRVSRWLFGNAPQRQGNGIRNQRMLYCKLSSRVYKQEATGVVNVMFRRKTPVLALVGNPIHRLGLLHRKRNESVKKLPNFPRYTNQPSNINICSYEIIKHTVAPKCKLLSSRSQVHDSSTAALWPSAAEEVRQGSLVPVRH